MAERQPAQPLSTGPRGVRSSTSAWPSLSSVAVRIRQEVVPVAEDVHLAQLPAAVDHRLAARSLADVVAEVEDPLIPRASMSASTASSAGDCRGRPRSTRSAPAPYPHPSPCPRVRTEQDCELGWAGCRWLGRGEVRRRVVLAAGRPGRGRNGARRWTGAAGGAAIPDAEPARVAPELCAPLGPPCDGVGEPPPDSPAEWEAAPETAPAAFRVAVTAAPAALAPTPIAPLAMPPPPPPPPPPPAPEPPARPEERPRLMAPVAALPGSATAAPAPALPPATAAVIGTAKRRRAGRAKIA